MPVYLSGIIQLITVVILLSRKNIQLQYHSLPSAYLCSQCIVYTQESDKMGQFGPLCRNFSYLMILFPLINVILVLSSDYLKICFILNIVQVK